MRKSDVHLFLEYRAVRVSGGAKQREIELRNQLVARNILLAYDVFNKFWGAERQEHYDDIKQVALMGLIKAIEGFDCTKKATFATYAVPVIRGEMSHYVRDKMQNIRTRSIEYALGQGKITKLEACRQQYEVRNMLSLSIPSRDPDGTTVILQDKLAATETIDSDEILALHQEIDKLPDQLQAVARLRSQAMSCKDIAKQLQVTPVTVSRRLVWACDRLKQLLLN